MGRVKVFVSGCRGDERIISTDQCGGKAVCIDGWRISLLLKVHSAVNKNLQITATAPVQLPRGHGFQVHRDAGIACSQSASQYANSLSVAGRLHLHGASEEVGALQHIWQLGHASAARRSMVGGEVRKEADVNRSFLLPSYPP